MSKKSKGINGERSLVHAFWDRGWAAMRSPGSGSTRHPSPDLICGTPERKLAIECKVTGSSAKYFPREEIEQLRSFCASFGAEPWIGLKFKKMPWLFLTLEDLRGTPGGYAAPLQLAKDKGLTVDELIG